MSIKWPKHGVEILQGDIAYAPLRGLSRSSTHDPRKAFEDVVCSNFLEDRQTLCAFEASFKRRFQSRQLVNWSAFFIRQA